MTGPACFEADREFVEPTTAEKIEATEFYAERGFPVLLLSPDKKLPIIRAAHPEGYGCKGECGQDGHGAYDATTELGTLRRWWKKYPHAAVGIGTGVSCEVLDLDVKDGLDAGALIDSYADEHGYAWGDMADEATQVAVGSPSGGIHLYVQPCGGKTRANLLKREVDREKTGIDYRGYGGLAVAPPSWSAKRQRRYLWAGEDYNRELPSCPDWLAEIARGPIKPRTDTVLPREVTVDVLDGDTTPYAKAVLSGACETIAAAVDGTRNPTLNGLAYRVGRFVAGGEIRWKFAEDCVVTAATRCGYAEARARQIVLSAFGAAKDDPARTPPSTKRRGVDDLLGVSVR